MPLQRPHRSLKILILYSAVCVGAPLHDDAMAQFETRVHTAGRVKRVVSNGSLIGGTYAGVVCEYPPGEATENSVAGYPVLEIAAVNLDQDSVHHFYSQWWEAGDQREDTIWTVRGFDSADIPRWGHYAGLADEDFVFRSRNTQPHTLVVRCGNAATSVPVVLPPLHIELLTSSMAWSVPPLDDIILTRYRIVSERYRFSDLYVSTYFVGGIGPSSQPYNRTIDDRTLYDTEMHLAIVTDGGMFDGVQSNNCVGYRLFPPRTSSPGSIRWTTKDDFSRTSALECATTAEAYATVMHTLLSSGVQMQGRVSGANWIAAGPFSLAPGETLEVWTAEILGQGVDDVVKKNALLDLLSTRGFVTPRPPPAPPLRIDRSDKALTLRWDMRAGDPDPEHFHDERRWDGCQYPFEGYRIYKSTKSRDGPWALLYECDIADNGIASDFGLTHSYSDNGLVNHAEYYYAVSSFSRPDTVSHVPSRESRFHSNGQGAIPGAGPRERVGDVAAVPNPYRSDIAYNAYDPPWERPSKGWPVWTETDRRIRFINLPRDCAISIYTLAGDMVYLIRHSDANLSFHEWNLTSYVGQAVASGIYLFTVEDQNSGEVQVGKFVIIR